MTVVRVPDPHRLPLAALAALPDPQFDAILRVFDELEVNRTPKAAPTRGDLINAAASTDLTEQDAERMVDALLSLQVFRSNHGWTTEALATAVSRSPDIDIGAVDGSKWALRLAKLLQVDAVAVLAKAFDVISDYEHVFSRARILTDARPVFGENVLSPPTGMVVVQTLKLDYLLQNGEVRSFYVSMDNSRLRELQRVVARALDKTTSLNDVLARSGVPHVEPETDKEGDSEEVLPER